MQPAIVILAAGQGKRMHSDLPKVLHPVLFRPMLHYVIDAATAVSQGEIVLVVGHGEEKVRAACETYKTVRFARQEKQLGTADAVKAAMGVLKTKTGSMLVLSGDVMLLSPETLKGLLATHQESKASATVVTAELENPTGYGRILRDGAGQVSAIREEKDCSPSEREKREVNSGIYCFEVADLLSSLDKVTSQNSQGEYYLTDVIGILVAAKKRVLAQKLTDPGEMTGINDRAALAEVECILRTRTNHALMMAGVTLDRPESITISPDSRIAPDVRIECGSTIVSSRIDAGAVIEAQCRILHSTISQGATIKQGSYIESSEVGKRTNVGPYAHLRPASKLKEDVKIGNFVEVKKSTFESGAKASHLSYVGDAEIGRNVNLGCGFITCNFDGGPEKHKTVIEDGVFVGSDSQTVAPVTIGKGSYIASGSTITDDVPADSLVLSRGRQIVKPGYAKKYRK